MKGAAKQRNALIKVMQERMIAAERKAEEESIEKIDIYQKYEKQQFREIERVLRKNMSDKSLPDYRPYEDDLMKKVDTLQGDLLEIEIKLQHALKGNQESAQELFKKQESDLFSAIVKYCEEFEGFAGNIFKEFGERL